MQRLGGGTRPPLFLSCLRCGRDSYRHFSSVERLWGITFGGTSRIEFVELSLDAVFAIVDSHRFGKAEFRLVMIPAPERVSDDAAAPADIGIRNEALGFALHERIAPLCVRTRANKLTVRLIVVVPKNCDGIFVYRPS